MGGDDAADIFLPLEENNMELDEQPEEQVDRHQVSLLVLIYS